MTVPLHYGIKSDGLIIYAGDAPILRACKSYQLVDVAAQCLSGKLVLPTVPEPTTITDHPWLLRLAGDCAHQAARQLGGE